MFLALAQLTNKAFTDAGKGRIRQSLTALVVPCPGGQIRVPNVYLMGLLMSVDDRILWTLVGNLQLNSNQNITVFIEENWGYHILE